MTDRLVYIRLLRLAVALDCGAVATLPWVYDTRSGEVFDSVLAGLAIVAGLALVLAAVVGDRLPALIIDPAAALAIIVLVAQASERVLYRGTSTWPHVVRDMLFSLGGALVAIVIMSREHRRHRRAP